MNRVKLWLFTVLAVGAGLVWLNAVSDWTVVRSIESIDARLQAAKALAESRSLLYGREVSAVAGAAARDPALLRVLAPPQLTAASEAPRVKRPVRPLPLTGPAPRVRPPPPPAPVVAPQPQPQPQVDPLPTAETVARAAVEAAGLDPGRGMVAGLVRMSRLTLRSKGQDVRVEGDASVSSLLETARDGRAREALVRVEGATYRVSVAPIPTAPGVALAIGVPPDIDWIHSIRDATGVEVILPPNGKPVIGENKLILDTVQKPMPGAVSVGKFGTARLPGVSWAPQISLLFTDAPAWRATGVALPGIAGTVVLCRSTRSELEPLSVFQQKTLFGLAGLFLLGLVIGFLVKNEPPVAIPKELFQAADRIAHGEFGVRAPALAGQLGTVADALNRAAEVAATSGRSDERTLEAPEPLPAATPYQEEPPQEAPPQEVLSQELEPPEAPPQEVIPQEALPQEAPALPPTDPFFGAAAPLSSGSSEATARDFFAGMGRATALFSSPEAATAAPPEFAPSSESFPAASPPMVAEPEPEPEPAPSVEPPPMELPPMEPPPMEPAPVEQPAPVAEAAPAVGGSDEEHWRQVFEEFLLIRRQCGEPADGLTFEKFRQKLQKNRDSLIQKYGCKVVRFQAYVKDGKAALKATPVR